MVVATTFCFGVSRLNRYDNSVIKITDFDYKEKLLRIPVHAAHLLLTYSPFSDSCRDTGPYFDCFPLLISDSLVLLSLSQNLLKLKTMNFRKVRGPGLLQQKCFLWFELGSARSPNVFLTLTLGYFPLSRK